MQAQELFSLEGSTAVVTGAASGLGLAYVEALADNGAAVLMADIDGPGLEREAERLRSKGRDIETAVVDVADATGLARAFSSFFAVRGRIDAAFANAGMSAGPGFGLDASGWLENIELDAFDRVAAVNLRGALHTMGLAAKAMKLRRRGSIVATASIAGLRAEPNCGYAYASTKAALCNAVRQAARELAPFNIRVNAIAPGPFLTNIAGGRLHRDPAIAESFAKTVPLGRLAKPDEIKGLALLLASDAGSFITGAVIPIDGGSTAG